MFVIRFCWLYLIHILHALTSTGRATSQKQGKGQQCYANCSFNMEVIINHVKGVEILLASACFMYAFYALCWYSILRLRAFSVICCGELSLSLQTVFKYVHMYLFWAHMNQTYPFLNLMVIICLT